MLVTISFSVILILLYKEKEIKIKQKHIDSIPLNIFSNCRRNGEDNIFSYELGVFHLINLQILKNKTTHNLFHFKIVVDIENNLDINVDNKIEISEEIIWSIFPVFYSTESRDRFYFGSDYKYCFTSLDTPHDVDIQF